MPKQSKAEHAQRALLNRRRRLEDIADQRSGLVRHGFRVLRGRELAAFQSAALAAGEVKLARSAGTRAKFQVFEAPALFAALRR